MNKKVARRVRAMGAMVGIAALGACQAEPRAMSYFKEHDQERAEVLAACAGGKKGGAECMNADLAETAIVNRRGFEARQRANAAIKPSDVIPTFKKPEGKK